MKGTARRNSFEETGKGRMMAAAAKTKPTLTILLPIMFPVTMSE
jgi:hypothetical protein